MITSIKQSGKYDDRRFLENDKESSQLMTSQCEEEANYVFDDRRILLSDL